MGLSLIRVGEFRWANGFGLICYPLETSTQVLKVMYIFLPQKKMLSLSLSLSLSIFIGDSLIHSLSWEQVNETQNNMN